jgi:hypothetical protein
MLGSLLTLVLNGYKRLTMNIWKNTFDILANKWQSRGILSLSVVHEIESHKRESLDIK